MQNRVVSIIVPTYKEADNIPALAQRIHEAMVKEGLEYEVVIVDDDSKDGIEQKVNELDPKYAVKLKIRKDERGLSSAVIEGFKIARGDIFVVMDADLSHPPEKIPELITAILNGEADFVIGSRFVEGGGVPHFNFYRKINAWIPRVLARPLTSAKDPMAGFFAFPRSLLKENIKLNPLGFKIGLELIVKCSPRNIREVPIIFQERLHGESKLNVKEQINYLVHLKRLFEYKFQTIAEFIKFSLIGGSGMLTDLGTVWLTYGLLNIPYRTARALGFMVALTYNFLLNRRFTFLGARAGNPIKQYILFLVVCLVGFGVNWSISVYLFEHVPFFNIHYLVSAFMGVLGGLAVNFTESKYLAFR